MSSQLDQAATTLAASTAFLADLFDKVGRRSPGGNPHQFLERFDGGKLVELHEFEPDPVTFRHEYYYNTVANRLYRRVVTKYEPSQGLIRAYWQGVSE